jgi:BMFP domain-containing protein YqiC
MRLRLTIRDFLWLTVVAAMAIGWWLDHRSVQRRNDFLEDQLHLAESDAKEIRSNEEAVRLIDQQRARAELDAKTRRSIDETLRMLDVARRNEFSRDVLEARLAEAATKPGHLIGTVPDTSKAVDPKPHSVLPPK